MASNKTQTPSELLDELRKKLNVGEEGLPKLLGVSRTTVYRYRRNSSMAVRVKLRIKALLMGGGKTPEKVQPTLGESSLPFQGDPFCFTNPTSAKKFQDIKAGQCFIRSTGSVWRRIVQIDLSRIRWAGGEPEPVNAIRISTGPNQTAGPELTLLFSLVDDKEGVKAFSPCGSR